jgi:hypothetical protein
MRKYMARFNRETIKQIRSLGLTCVCDDEGEFRVNFPKRKGMTHDREATAYYTSDAHDAFETAKVMASRLAEETAD